jgi:SAM-dependent methyltransferase
MHLFRLMPLKHLPLPFTFAAVLTGFLTFWSIGAALSSWRNGPGLPAALKLGAAGCVLSIALSGIDSFTAIHGTGSLILFVLRKTPFFLPCVLFGYMFAKVAEQAAKSWGRDVGRIYVWNTAGSCLGILLMTFVGYEIPFFLAVIALALILYSLTGCAKGLEARSSGRVLPDRIPLLAGCGLVAACFVVDTTQLVPGYRLFCGRDGVIVVHDNGDLVWDGLWHSKLSDGTDHIGTHNWHLGVMPVVCHAEEPIEQVCVIGVGTGITASTLAKLDEVQQVDAYDISRVLEDVFAAYPEGTLNLADNPKINLIWQDARSGLELSSKQYDLIQTQPLYLKQAGSALLNSEEFLQLVSRRLKPGGVFCLYSNGTPEQAFTVRETADRVFPYRESFFDGYLVILSNDPIRVDHDVLSKRLNSADPLWQEIAGHQFTSSADQILGLLDVPGLPGSDGSLVISDDRPIVEYPEMLKQRLRVAELPFELPKPDSSHSHRDQNH